jgi:molybdenum cofactor biosynthesis enzyme MoaA
MKEWKSPYNSFNSWKGMLYAPWYQAIRDWKDGNAKVPLPPVEASLDPIHACQLMCEHCNAHKYLVGDSRVHRMSDEHIINLTKFLGEWGVKAICFTGDTKIKLVNGETKSFKELEKEWKKNKQSFEVYSRNKDGNIVPGIACNPRKTRKVNQIIELTLDNGEVIKSTLDHKFMLKNGDYKEAKDLKISDSLSPLNTKILSDGYEFIMDTTYQGATHRLFSHYWEKNIDKIRSGELVVHHKNFNKKDNTKNNLEQMSPKEHGILHTPVGEHKRKLEKGRDKWNKSNRGQEFLKQHMKEEQLKYARSNSGRKQSSLNLIKYNKSEKGRETSANNWKRWNSSKEGLEHHRSMAIEYGKSEKHLKNNKNPKYILNRKIGQALKTIRILENLNLEVTKNNYEKYRKNGLPSFEKAMSLVYNHKIIKKKIVTLNKPIQMYCMTVEKYHNFALEAGVFVKNCYGGGGEPTLHTNLGNALLTCKESGMDASIATNGIAFTDELIEIMARTCRWVGISIDSASAETYKKGRKLDVFYKGLENIKRLTNKVSQLTTNCDVAYKFLIMPYNQDEIFRACVLAKDLGVKDFHARPADFRHQGMGELQDKENTYDIANIKEQFEMCHQLETEDFRVFTVMHKFSEDFRPKKDFSQCYASPCCIQLCADGNVYLCPDQRHAEEYKICTHYPDPYEILKYWGGKKHYDLVFTTGKDNCETRCTFAPYCKQCEELFIKDTDPMCWKFI